jgi:Ring finger domain
MNDINDYCCVNGVGVVASYGDVRGSLLVSGVNCDVMVKNVYGEINVSGVGCTVKVLVSNGSICMTGVNCLVYLQDSTGRISNTGVNCRVVFQGANTQGPNFRNVEVPPLPLFPQPPNIQNHNQNARINVGQNNFAAFSQGIFQGIQANMNQQFVGFQGPGQNIRFQMFQNQGPQHPPAFIIPEFHQQQIRRHHEIHEAMHRQNLAQNQPQDLSSESHDYLTDKHGRRVDIERIQGCTTSIDHECVICMADFNKMTDNCALLDCLHWFHFDCAKDWLKTQAACPVCKVAVQRVMMTCP